MSATLNDGQFRPWTQHDKCPVPDIARPGDRYGCSCGKDYQAVQHHRGITWTPA